MPLDIKSLNREELELQFKEWNEPAFRVTQLLDWLYARRATCWEAMSNLPKTLREKLRANFSLQTLELARKQGARDTTQKFLWKLVDGSFIESVLIPANPALYGEASDRHTLCISTQVGCAYGCKFCASGLEGWKRNLGVHEIVEQILAVERWHTAESCQLKVEGSKLGRNQPATFNQQPSTDSRVVNNIVVMGMGEPLANYDNLLKALKILNAPWGGGIGARKITISTSGLAPQIRKLANEPLQFRLAISLHGATDEVRNRIMPVNRKYPLLELAAACDDYQKLKGRMITLEYILIAGINDSLAQVRPLAALAKRLYAKVNLIPYNKVEDLPWQRPEEDVCENFLAALEKLDVTATLRREKGGDIDAACGQLRLKTERELNAAVLQKTLCAFALALSVLLGLAGCATPSGGVTSTSVVTSRPVSLDSIVVTTASSLPDLAAEKTLLNDRIISGLRETGLFASIGTDGAGTNSGSGIKVAVEIKAITKVSDDSRQWFGGLAGQAAITVQVTVTDLSSGRRIEIFNAEGKSGASARAGTTEAAINQAAGQVVAEIVKLNAQTSQ